MKKFTNESMVEIISWLAAEVQRNNDAGRIIEFLVPDITKPEENQAIASSSASPRKRPLRCWFDLAEYFDCRFLLPVRHADEYIRIRLQILDKTQSWHDEKSRGDKDKYGINSGFSQINKLDEPYFLLDYLSCLRKANIQPGWSVLNLGVNNGEEFSVFENIVSSACHETLHFVGIDKSATAIRSAQQRFADDRFRFYCADFNNLEMLEVKRFQLIISLATLQSPAINRQRVLRQITQHFCADAAVLIFAFPNCRYIDGEMKFGAKVKNFSEPELSLLIKDIAFFKKYLQQHKFTVQIFGKYYIFVLGIRKSKVIGK